MSRTAMTKEMDHMEMIWASLTCSVVYLWYVHVLCVWLLAAGHVLFLIWTCTCELSVGPVGCLIVSCLWLCEWVECWTCGCAFCVVPLHVCGCLASLPVNCDVLLWLVCYVAQWLCDCTVVLCCCQPVILSSTQAVVWICCCHSVLLSSVYAWLQLLRRANCFKWLHVYRCFRFYVINSRS